MSASESADQWQVPAGFKALCSEMLNFDVNNRQNDHNDDEDDDNDDADRTIHLFNQWSVVKAVTSGQFHDIPTH